MKVKLKLTLLVLIGICLSASLALRKTSYAQNQDKTNMSLKTQLEIAAKALNIKTPIVVDEFTTVTSVSVKGDNILTYVNTVDSEAVGLGKGRQSDGIIFFTIFAITIEKICNNKSVLATFRHGAKFEYEYRDLNGNKLDSFILDQYICDYRKIND